MRNDQKSRGKKQIGVLSYDQVMKESLVEVIICVKGNRLARSIKSDN